MPIEIIVPRLGWSMEEGAFVAWLKKDGESVRSGELLFSIEGDKAIQEIESLDAGILRIAPNAPAAGDAIRVGDILGHLLSDAEARQVDTQVAFPSSKPQTSSDIPTSAVPVASPPPSPPSLPTHQPSQAQTIPPTSQDRVTISPRALRAAEALGVDWTRVVGSGRTGRIREQDILAASIAHKSPDATPRSILAPIPTGECVLVTGGCGFIGTWVVRELLNRGLAVVVLDMGGRPARWERLLGAQASKVPLVAGSLLDRQLLARVFSDYEITHVIHLAALLTPACQDDPFEGSRVNLLGSVALFEQVRLSSATVRGFSYASSVTVFGDEPGDVAASSVEGHGPMTFYGVFKKSLEMIASQYWRHFQIASLGIRPQVAYGPEREVGLTAGPSLAARAAARGEAFRISYTGSVGYDYVEDVARAFVRGALETPPGADVVDLAGETASLEDVIAAIVEVAPTSASRLSCAGPLIPAHAPTSPRFISSLYADWKTTSLRQGIRQTIEFYISSSTPVR